MELDPGELAPEKTFFDDLGLDSIDMVDLIIGLQRKFGVSLREDDEIKKVRTLGSKPTSFFGDCSSIRNI